MNTIGGIKPLFGECLYEVSTTQGQGYLYYDESDEEWLNVEINDQFQPLEGDVTLIHRKVLDSSILETEEMQVH